MNQILVTKKVYVTPDMYRKRRFYKLDFFISVFIVCLLFSFYIYAEFDKTKSEAVSQTILGSLDIQKIDEVIIDNTVISSEDNVLIILDPDAENTEVHVNENLDYLNNMTETYTSKSGDTYQICAIVEIPKLGISYPVVNKSTMELLKESVCKLWGPEPNEEGNFCLVAHNYRNDKFFSRIATLEYGDIIEITDSKGRTLEYAVWDKYEVQPEDTSCTSQLTNGKKEITLITCTSDSMRRTIVKAVAK